jgi:hypothetical protein
MRPFDLELWKAGEPVITRDGREVKELTYFESIKVPYKLCGTLDGLLQTWTIEGFFQQNKNCSNDDLFHPEPEMWVNVYKVDKTKVAGDIQESKEKAQNSIGNKNAYIGTYKLVKP